MSWQVVESLELFTKCLLVKTTELNKELETLRESEATQRTRAQKAIQRLRDVEGELLDLKARNEILEVRNTRHVTHCASSSLQAVLRF